MTVRFAGIALIVIGGVVLIVSLLGCIGACCRIKCALLCVSAMEIISRIACIHTYYNHIFLGP